MRACVRGKPCGALPLIVPGRAKATTPVVAWPKVLVSTGVTSSSWLRGRVCGARAGRLAAALATPATGFPAASRTVAGSSRTGVARAEQREHVGAVAIQLDCPHAVDLRELAERRRASGRQRLQRRVGEHDVRRHGV